MFAMCGSLVEANQAFRRIRELDTHAWAAIISAHTKNGQTKEAIKLYYEMQQTILKPNDYIYVIVIKACTVSLNLTEGRMIHAKARENGYDLNLFVGSTLIDMYAKCGSLEEAQQVFCALPSRDVVAWNTIIAAYAQKGVAEQALQLFKEMQEEGICPDGNTFVSILKACGSIRALDQGKMVHTQLVNNGLLVNVFVGSSLVDMYVKCGRLAEAHDVFEKLPKRDVVSWSTLIAGYAQQGLGEQALQLYKSMQSEGVKPDKVMFVSILKACGSIAALDEGKLVHNHIRKYRLESDVFVGSALVDMYAKCRDLVEARKVFNDLVGKDIISWNTMIAGYAQSGLSEQALELFKVMQREGTKPNDISLVNALKACSSIASLTEGKMIHNMIIEEQDEIKPYVGSALIDMYAKCKKVDEARLVYNSLGRNLVSSNAMIAGFLHNGLEKEALQVYEDMQWQGIMPDRTTIVSILKACGSLGAIDQGRIIHSQTISLRLESDLYVGSSLVDMYAKCGSLDEASQIFGKLPKRDLVLWNTMIAGYSQHGLGQQAIQLFDKMQQEGMKPNDVTFLNLLKACGSLLALDQGKLMHDHINENGFDCNILIESALVDMYAKCGALEESQAVFSRMTTRDVVSWNALIAGYAQHWLGEHALQTFATLQQEGMKPDNVTFLCILKACCNIGAIDKGRLVHLHILEIGLALDVSLVNTLVDMYSKYGSLDEACDIFENVLVKDVVTWNAMIAGFIHHGHAELALQLYQKMQHEGIRPDSTTFVSLLKACGMMSLVDEGKCIHADVITSGMDSDILVVRSLVDMYVKLGAFVEAQRILDRSETKDVPSWNALIAAYVQQGLGHEAFHVFEIMQKEGMAPDGFTVVSILKACCITAALGRGKRVHDLIIKRGLEMSGSIGNSVVDMYAKCGSLDEARDAFDNLAVRDAASWNVMIAAYAQHGLGQEAILLFNKMQEQGVQPDDITFVSLLSACSHSSLLKDGYFLFHSMHENFGITPKMPHYSCIVDLLGRCGQLIEAEEIIFTMPWQPDAAIWMSLLGSCRTHGDIELGRRCFESILRLNPTSAAAFDLMSNMYASAGKWKERAEILKKMKVTGVKTNPGCTWID
ncbi:hypothetical protein O6H91_Y115100 [Diphasiastrum complanatum]|nr:hypothetical protein O6H91_Y115100 [Diphasiastrum complanatum]